MKTPPSGPLVGIDLGTTFSLVSCLQAGRPVVLPNSLGELLTPSAVSLDERGELLVGAPARARATTHPSRTARSFKRDMGSERRHDLGGRSFSPVELSSMVLRALKQDAEAALGCEVLEAVVTVPAYFGDLQRQATRDAGVLAGLRVERIINEPTAAALAYGLHELAREQRVVVLDLGGGTFDVTVLELISGVIEIQASAGDVRLGGDDFTHALAELAAERYMHALGQDPREDNIHWARLLEASEQAKRRLSTQGLARVLLPNVATSRGHTAFETTLTAEEAAAAWAPLMERARGPILRALRDAQLAPSRVDEVLLVGGASRMPWLHTLVAKLFGRLPHRQLPPDEAVAQGAAIQAALKGGDRAVEDLVVTDVAPFSLGVSTAAFFGRQQVTGLFTPILERGTVIPASRVTRVQTVADNQTEVRVEVYQGEHSLCRDNTRLGEYVVSRLPPRAAGEEMLDVRLSYDLDGVVEVEMTVVSTGQAESFVIEQRPGLLTPAQVEEARRAMAHLKFHPREALPNTTALARADALFAELTGLPRSELGACIAAFHAALETQEPVRITHAREQLVALTAALGH